MQPTPVWGGLGAVLFDGRLDDRAGLCRELGIAVRESLPDSELVARAFEKWGAAAVTRLIGDFAIAAWDGQSRRAFLCADPNGNRPLYFHRAGKQLSFSTTLPALLSCPGVACEFDELVVANVLANRFEDSRNSFFRGITRVLAGTTVTLSAFGEDVVRYWQPGRRPQLVLKSDEDYVDAAREVLDKAVKSRLRSLIPVPVMGSAGLDSSCIVISIANQTNAEIPLFTAVPEPGAAIHDDRKYADERAPIAAMQAAFPLLAPRFIEPVAAPDMEFAPDRIFDQIAAPLFNIMAAGWWAATLDPMRAQGATSCLAGHMGNKTLSWDGEIGVANLFRQGRWIRMANEAYAHADRRPLDALRSILGRILRPPASRGTSWRDGTEQRVIGLTSRRTLLAETNAWARARYGIEIRDPFDDVRMIDFCLSIPEDQFLRSRQTRWLARRLLRAAGVPAQVTENNRRGAWHPVSFSRLQQRRAGFEWEIARLRESPAAVRLLDLDRLSRLAAEQPNSAAGLPGTYPTLARALHSGAFIRWAETHAAASAASHKYPSLAITAP